MRLCSGGPTEMRFTCFVLSLGAFVLVPLTGLAAERARLELTREDGAADCPDARALGDAVGARLGYEPFAEDATRVVVVTFRREGATLVGAVQMRDADGTVRGERVLTSARRDCGEVSSAASLTISILLDPRSGMIPKKPEASEPTPDERPVAPAPPPADKASPTPPAEPFYLRATLSAAGSVGVAPSPSFGVLAGLGVAHRWWSASAEFRADLPAEDEIGGLTAKARFIAGSLVPCAHVGHAYFCAVVSLGAIQGELAPATPSRQSTFHALLGPRVGVSLPLVHGLSLDAHLDGSYALTTTTLRAAAAEVWTTPTLSALAAIGMEGRFP